MTQDFGDAPDANEIAQAHGVDVLRDYVDGATVVHLGKLRPEAKPNRIYLTPPIEPFETFDAGDWEGVAIKPRRWTVLHRIPAGEPGIVSGDGGTGKTKLMLQLCVAVGAELPDWVGGVIETHGPVIVFSAEEKLDEMHRRVADIVAHRGLSFLSLRRRLHFICDPDDVTLARVDRDVVKPTSSLLRLEKTVALIRPALVMIENAADVYAGDENNRSTVSRFVRKYLGGLTQPSEAPVALIQHPSVSGLQDGTGRSGTTGWNNSGRWRINFTKIKSDDGDSGLRQLEVVKANYGPNGEKVQVRWERGVFVPEGTESTVDRAAVDQEFLRYLDRAAGTNQVLSHSHHSAGYAPKVFFAMGCRRPLGALVQSMQRLLDLKVIEITTIKTGHRHGKEILRRAK